MTLITIGNILVNHPFPVNVRFTVCSHTLMFVVSTEILTVDHVEVAHTPSVSDTTVSIGLSKFRVNLLESFCFILMVVLGDMRVGTPGFTAIFTGNGSTINHVEVVVCIEALIRSDGSKSGGIHNCNLMTQVVGT